MISVSITKLDNLVIFIFLDLQFKILNLNRVCLWVYIYTYIHCFRKIKSFKWIYICFSVYGVEIFNPHWIYFVMWRLLWLNTGQCGTSTSQNRFLSIFGAWSHSGIRCRSWHRVWFRSEESLCLFYRSVYCVRVK